MLFGQQECPRMYVATHMYTEIKNKMFPHSLVHRDQKQNVPPLTRTQRSKTKCSPTHLSTEIKNKMFPPLTRTQRSKTKCSPTHMYTEIKNKMFPQSHVHKDQNKMFPHSHVHRDQKQNVPPLTCTQRSKTKCSLSLNLGSQKVWHCRSWKNPT